ncbi:GntR family transcriptional regulator [Actinoplanes auranticolor]|uniref:Transcriptional regulator, GntR family protein n=1 Tax=Actinoplanes auranticolor TaxID=47988 RepID=A0A919S793_9ACTN|nr:GntR family transcriptional regulator [Actinoplanes auranticolor]GIM65755.1 putative transcriptional regulator, GntR family protein [Actinoplanes auranticolor]
MPIPSGGPAVDRSLLRDDVLWRLRDAIVDGTFTPGEQLKDGELAEWLGVSRTPVREALLRLGSSGLVVALPGRSTRVSTIDAPAVRDARDVIAAMHELAVRQTTGRLGAEDINRMRDANRRFAEAVEAGDIGAALDADEEIHRIPVTALGNHAVETVLDQFDPLVRRAERLRFSGDGHASVELHSQLIELIAAGDVQAAASVAFDMWHTLPAEDGTDADPARPPL